MKEYFINQYNAALTMLKDCIGQYDEKIWLDAEKYTTPAWDLAYHTIYLANLYGAAKEEDFTHWPADRDPKEGPFSTDEMLAMIDYVQTKIPIYMENLEPDKDCWPNWYNISQFEFMINNLRHIQHHTAQLMERHNAVSKITVDWQRF